jgi:hypothetical protein
VSTAREIADALADSLDAYSFTAVTPSVVRQNWPSYDIEDMADPVVAVMPGGIETTRADRVHWQYDYAIIVFVGRHAPTEQLADDTLALAEEMVDAIRQHDWDEAVTWPTGVTSPMEVEVALNPDEGLQERNVWRAVITATYRVHRT